MDFLDEVDDRFNRLDFETDSEDSEKELEESSKQKPKKQVRFREVVQVIPRFEDNEDFTDCWMCKEEKEKEEGKGKKRKHEEHVEEFKKSKTEEGGKQVDMGRIRLEELVKNLQDKELKKVMLAKMSDKRASVWSLKDVREAFPGLLDYLPFYLQEGDSFSFLRMKYWIKCKYRKTESRRRRQKKKDPVEKKKDQVEKKNDGVGGKNHPSVPCFPKTGYQPQDPNFTSFYENQKKKRKTLPEVEKKQVDSFEEKKQINSSEEKKQIDSSEEKKQVDSSEEKKQVDSSVVEDFEKQDVCSEEEVMDKEGSSDNDKAIVLEETEKQKNSVNETEAKMDCQLVEHKQSESMKQC